MSGQLGPAGGHEAVMRVTVLYPDRLNLYADRGNVLVLAQRCRRRGIRLEVTALRLGDPVADLAADLIYLGGGQDRDQQRCATDLGQRRDGILAALAGGATVLGVCGGYQLLGHEYTTDGGVVVGLGLLDVVTSRPEGARLVGNVVVDLDRAAGLGPSDPAATRPLVGFENHHGRTTLGPAARPLGTVRVGHGNNGTDGTEGAVAGRVIGTYLHGPLLAKNAWLADVLIERAVGGPLPRLADPFEDAVHARAVRAAGTGG
ncbi:MAG: glutamine amidotransferase [Acidimicrobiaceae bacterium]|nr:glutamine amidotransferase [Ilumatobacter sp.]MCB9381267.1 glutamine amidotransferase [Acidimicrobiaceae bacterium]MCO5330104.1 hypothetical protein [Ilumatobacteraceae bacterium]